MTDKLPPDYLKYPDRSYGQDQDRYEWAFKPSVISTTSDEKIAISIIIPIERFILNPAGTPFRAPGAMVTHYPDLRHYTSRDYGNRIGAFRLLKILRNLDIPATFAVSAKLLTEVKPLIDRIKLDGHEIAALGLDMDAILWEELDQDTEQQWVEETRSLFSASDLVPKTWMSPARQQSTRTLDIIAAHGFTACLDWEFDCTPTPMRTDNGTVMMVPNLNELDDRKILIEKRQSEAVWSEQVIEAATYSQTITSAETPQGFAITLTPYISGLPFRIRAVKETLENLKSIAEFKTAHDLAFRT